MTVDCKKQDLMGSALLSNPFKCFLLMMRYEEAEEDCTQAVLLDSSYSKAYARRGTARAALGKLKEAMQGGIFNGCVIVVIFR